MKKHSQFAAGLVLSLALLPEAAHAVSRYVSTSMTCVQIQSTVRNERQAILAWRDEKTNLPRYGLYIANRSVCLPGYGTNRVYVPASDKKLCLVKRCIPLDLGSAGR
jgi:hypothetical protein